MSEAREEIVAAFAAKLAGLAGVRVYRARSVRTEISNDAASPVASIFAGGHEAAARQVTGMDIWEMSIAVEVAVRGDAGDDAGADAEKKLHALHARIVEAFDIDLPGGETFGGKACGFEETGMDEPAHEDGDIVTATIAFRVQYATPEGRPSQLVPA